MKRIIYVLTAIMLLSFLSCNQGNPDEMVIGKIESNTLVMTAKESDLIVILERVLVRQENNAKITNIELKKAFVEGRESESYYYLLGNNKEQSTKIAVDLSLNSDVLTARLIQVRSFMEFVDTATCSGTCTSGCNPKKWIEDNHDLVWLCTPCEQSDKTCNKSVTAGR